MLRNGISVQHKKFGEGIIEGVNRSYLLIKFSSEPELKKLGLPKVIAGIA
jgi:hypothetical protein